MVDCRGVSERSDRTQCPQELAGQVGEDARLAGGPPTRKPYVAPKLWFLGSVRELTLGGSGLFMDAMGMRMGMM
jgi:hypothetical protein